MDISQYHMIYDTNAITTQYQYGVNPTLIRYKCEDVNTRLIQCQYDIETIPIQFQIDRY